MADYWVYCKTGNTTRYDRIAFNMGHEMTPDQKANMEATTGLTLDEPLFFQVADDFDLASIEFDADGNLYAVSVTEAAERDANGTPEPE